MLIALFACSLVLVNAEAEDPASLASSAPSAKREAEKLDTASTILGYGLYNALSTLNGGTKYTGGVVSAPGGAYNLGYGTYSHDYGYGNPGIAHNYGNYGHGYGNNLGYGTYGHNYGYGIGHGGYGVPVAPAYAGYGGFNQFNGYNGYPGYPAFNGVGVGGLQGYNGLGINGLGLNGYKGYNGYYDTTGHGIPNNYQHGVVPNHGQGLGLGLAGYYPHGRAH